jgi:hypothetical protein
MSILSDLRQQGTLGRYAREFPNFICSHVPTEIFIFYKTGMKPGNQKIHALRWPSLRTTHLYKDLPYKQIIYINCVVCSSVCRGPETQIPSVRLRNPETQFPSVCLSSFLKPRFVRLSVEVLKSRSHLSVCRGLEMQMPSVHLSRS